MNSKILLTVFAILAVAGGAFGVLQMNSAADYQALIDQLKKQAAQAEKDRDAALAEKDRALADLKAARDEADRLAKERDDAKARTKELAGADKGAGAAGKNGEGRGPEVRGFLQGFAKQMDNPDFRKAMKSRQEPMIAAAYGELFKKLGLDDATAKLVTDLIGDRNMDAMAKGKKLMDGSVSGDDAMAGVHKEVEGVKAEYDGKLRAVLGEQGFNDFTAHEQTIGDQRALDSISRNLNTKGAPLQPEQRDSLATIMREERMKTPSNDIPDLGGGPGMGLLLSDDEAKVRQQQDKDVDQHILQRAPQAGLSPDQVTALGETLEQRQNQRVMSRAMGRVFLGGASGR